MLKYKNVKIVESYDWDNLVEETYEKIYHFQQQDGCQDRGIFSLSIPSEYTNDDDMKDIIPEEVNGEIMGVKFQTWLERDPKQSIEGQTQDYELELFWERNFYPCIYTLANDLYAKGLIEAGDYGINIDW